MWPTKKN